MLIVDARGLPCPRPVIETKKALESTEVDTCTVIVDNEESCQNVQRFAESQGCKVSVDKKEDGTYYIEIAKLGKSTESRKTGADVLMITSDQFGTGDEDLGHILITAFINTLPEAEPKPAKIIFINRGVLLTTEGSNVLDTLQQLEKRGVQIYSCGTCLNHYQIKDKLRVGKITNMYDTVESLLNANRIIRI